MAYLKVPLKINQYNVGFEVLTAVVMKSSIVWDTKPYTPLTVSDVSKEQALLPASCWCLAWFTLHPRRWRQHVPPKCQLTFTGLPGVTSQKTELFKSI
jgi:hypothetical protein